MTPKDPYLDELDSLDQEEGALTEVSTAQPTQESATRIDVPLEEINDKEISFGEEEHFSPPQESSVVKDLLDLSPDLAVQVTVVLSRREATVRDLLGLRMGQVVELDKSPTDAVDIVAGGKIIGKGELVDVEGKLGIRILKLLK